MYIGFESYGIYWTFIFLLNISKYFSLLLALYIIYIFTQNQKNVCFSWAFEDLNNWIASESCQIVNKIYLQVFTKVCQ